MSDYDTSINLEGLDKLVKALKISKPPVVRVGILGNGNGRQKTGGGDSQAVPTNAEIGVIHEFGSIARNIPQRSFLRVPISENIQKYLEKSGALKEDTLKEVMKLGTVIPWLKKIAILGVQIVADAFDSNGFGKWAAWKTPGYTNQTGQILVDTQQLRNSITSEVKE